MATTKFCFKDNAKTYLERINQCFTDDIYSRIEILANDLFEAWKVGQQVFICGNGGSAANAMHMANDFLYGIGACGSPPTIPGIKVEALSSNTSVLTCLANDTGYENIFSHQIYVKGKPGDLLIILSGSGNSVNIVRALESSREIGMRSHAIVAYTGGLAKKKADNAIHFAVNDMQVAEDTQLIVGHICMQWLNSNKPLNVNN